MMGFKIQLIGWAVGVDGVIDFVHEILDVVASGAVVVSKGVL